MLTVKQRWASTGASGGLTTLEVRDPPTEAVLYLAYSTLATSQSFSLQSAQHSTGPWFIEASTTIATAVSTQLAMKVTGPIGPFVRPYLNTASTGTYNFLLLGVE